MPGFFFEVANRFFYFALKLVFAPQSEEIEPTLLEMSFDYFWRGAVVPALKTLILIQLPALKTAFFPKARCHTDIQLS